MSGAAYPPVWVVNLPRSGERRAYISGHLAALGLPFEIIPAVDGRALSPAELATAYDPLRAVATIGRELTPGEIGCALSHLGLYERMVDEGVEAALIVEDDAELDPGLCRLLPALDELSEDWEVVLLYHGQGVLSWWSRRPFLAGYRVGRFARPAFGTVGYLLRRSAALKLLAHAKPVCAPIDHWTGGTLTAGLRLYGIDPLCVREASPSFAGGSIIANDRDRYWKQWGLPELPGGGGLYLYRAKQWIIRTYLKYLPGRAL